MDVSTIGSLSTALNQSSVTESAGMLVLKKATEIEAQSVLQLLQAVPPVPSNPPNLGNNIDVKA